MNKKISVNDVLSTVYDIAYEAREAAKKFNLTELAPLMTAMYNQQGMLCSLLNIDTFEFCACMDDGLQLGKSKDEIIERYIQLGWIPENMEKPQK